MRIESMLGSRIGYQMKRVQHALRLKMDDALQGIGLTTPQYAALSVLGEDPGLSGAALARRCFVTPQTMNQILAKLEAAGLVVRRSHPEHGRILQAYPTETGEKLLVQADWLVETLEQRMLNALSKDERLRLLDSLRRCADTLDAGGANVVTRSS